MVWFYCKALYMKQTGTYTTSDSGMADTFCTPAEPARQGQIGQVVHNFHPEGASQGGSQLPCLSGCGLPRSC